MNVQYDSYLNTQISSDIQEILRKAKPKSVECVPEGWRLVESPESFSDFSDYRKLSYKGVEFSMVLDEAVYEIFNDALDIKYEEMQMLSCLYPMTYKSVKKVWMQAYITWQAEKEFEKP